MRDPCMYVFKYEDITKVFWEKKCITVTGYGHRYRLQNKRHEAAPHASGQNYALKNCAHTLKN